MQIHNIQAQYLSHYYRQVFSIDSISGHSTHSRSDCGFSPGSGHVFDWVNAVACEESEQVEDLHWQKTKASKHPNESLYRKFIVGTN